MMKKLWLYALSICSVLLVGCNNGDDGLLDVPEGWAHKAVSLAVTPKAADIPMGLTQQLEADAVLETGQTVRVTTDSHLTWTSSDTSIATVDAAGLVTGITQGTVTITALGVNNDGTQVSDTATITVSDAIAVDLTVTPRTKLVAKGLMQQYKAEVLMSDNRVIDVTANAGLTWSSSDTAIATISNGADKGLATGVDIGVVDITAQGTVGSVSLSDTVKMTVTDATVTDFVVSPSRTSVPVGFEQPFTAEAVLSDGTVQDVTEQSTWTTSDPGTALVSDAAGTKGVAQGRAVSAADSPAEIQAQFTLGSNTYSDSGKLSVTDETVTAFNVTPATASVPVNLTQAFIAKATLNTGRVIDVTNATTTSWTTSDSAIASIDNGDHKGLATGEAAGSVTVTATTTLAGATHQDAAALDVTNATITGIVVTPADETTAVGLTKPFTATATLSDDTTRDITADPATSWSTDNHDIATISNTAGYNGLAKGEAPGSVTVKASYNAGSVPVVGSAGLTVTDATITAIQVEPAIASTPAGLTKSFTATALLSDDTTQNVTTDPSLSWTSSNSAIATISNGSSNKGEALGETVGTVTITATFEVSGGLEQGTATLNVTDAIVMALQVSPKTEETIKGLSVSFTAIATLSDSRTVDVTNNSALSWSSSDEGIASITSGLTGGGNGVATGVSLGEVTIKAYGTNNGQPFEDTATLKVIEADVLSIEVSPTTESTPIGLTKSFTANAKLSNNKTVDITNNAALSWTSSQPSIATITSNQIQGNGVAKGVALGQTTITATGWIDGTKFEDTATLDVTDAVIDELRIEPKEVETPLGLTQQFTATAYFSDDVTTQDVTHESGLSWSSDNLNFVTIVSDPTDTSRNGLATAVGKGAVTITASGYNSEGTEVKATATMTVTDAVINRLQITPARTSTPIGLTKAFTATGYFSDGIQNKDVTDDVSWTSSDTDVATVLSSQTSGNGVATGVSLGSVLIKASLNADVDATAALMVTPATPTGVLQITPTSQTIPNGTQTQPYEARAMMSDGSSPPVTDDMDWSIAVGDAAVATITTGRPGGGNAIATGLSVGEATINVTGTIHGTNVSGTATVIVSDAVATELVIEPDTEVTLAEGDEKQYAAKLILSDGTSTPVTSDARTSWQTTSPAASVTSDGLVRGVDSSVDSGTLSVRVGGTYNGRFLKAAAPLVVTPAVVESMTISPTDAEIPLNTNQDFTVKATLSDGRTDVDVTKWASTVWQSSNPSVATVISDNTPGGDTSLNGRATGVTESATPVQITATNNGHTVSANLTVTEANLLSIDVEPASVEVAAGDTAELIAWGTYTDTDTPADRVNISDLAGWTGQNTAFATVVGGMSSDGVTPAATVTGVAEGGTSTTACLNNLDGDPVCSDEVPITVNKPKVLVSISIDQGPVIELSDSTPEMALTVTGTYDDTTTGDVTDRVTWLKTEAQVFSGTTTTRIDFAENIVQSTNNPQDRNDPETYAQRVYATLDDLTTQEIPVLQCLSATEEPRYGTCLQEFQHSQTVDGVKFWQPSGTAMKAYGMPVGRFVGPRMSTTSGDDIEGFKVQEVCEAVGDLVGEPLREAYGADAVVLFNGVSSLTQLHSRAPNLAGLQFTNSVRVAETYTGEFFNGRFLLWNEYSAPYTSYSANLLNNVIETTGTAAVSPRVLCVSE
ncbi:beta strand repeat-containing protein [Vibrio alginolyticus]|uniref:beta strand repeat-containing protein n=1 Tax=Vibrio alginolyticus TaxID=663 RepID=UPI00211A0F2A|nr:Ig-like domain-containing protein [Vibrio alginolyticus]MCQ9091134.1 Ig-like domain-containing protein [Vibrio alginolyticus]